MKRVVSILLLSLVFRASCGSVAAEVDFSRDIQPILKEHCFQCHGPDRQKAKLRLDTPGGVNRSIRDDLIIPGNPGQSEIVRRIELPRDHDDVMPPEDKEKRLSTQQIARVKQWITEGARWVQTADSAAGAIDFDRDIEPILAELSASQREAILQWAKQGAPGIDAASASPQARVAGGLQAFYDFRSAEGEWVRDQAGNAHLKIENMDRVRRATGSLEIRGDTIIRSEEPPSRLIRAVRSSGEITLEAWIRPDNVNQSGPARIVTLSKDSVGRNFTLGQNGDRFDVRFRSTETSDNGLPSVSAPSNSAKTELTHVVYTRDRSGRTRLYINGEVSQEQEVSGAVSNWDESYRLALGNEFSADRLWKGSYYLVAIYSRDLLPREVKQNFQAGAGASLAGPFAEKSIPENTRTSSGLQAFYDFRSSDGEWVKDRVGSADLKIENLDRVRRTEGSLEIQGDTIVASKEAPSKLIRAVRLSGEIALEAWIEPANNEQEGPARILTLSRDSGARNFTLGQEGDRYDVRFRTSETSGNGLPSVSAPSNSAATKLTHVVYTRDRSGRTRIYINGEVSREQQAPGDVSNWDESFLLALGNEFGGGRLWKGTYRLAAIYNRDLLPSEVERNFKAGPEAKAGSALSAAAPAEAERKLFHTEIAPLFVQHCLECHDTANRKGGLDLSKRGPALAGGDSGKAFVPNNAEDSLLWKLVHNDEMPDDRQALSSDEKASLKKWIEQGAVWPVDEIDALAYSRQADAGVNRLRRLTVSEYIETVRAALGVDIEEEARELLPRDLRADGFSNTAYNLNVDLMHVEAYRQLADIIVGRTDVGKYISQFTNCREHTDKCVRELVAKMGQWILRGPLDDREIAVFRGIASTAASAGGGFEESVRYIIEAMLQSPRFLYRMEHQIGDGTRWPVGGFELASRMSYLIWGAPPDKALMRAAEEGKLYDREELARQIQRMLKDPRAKQRSLQFAGEWLNLGRLENLRPSPEKFPGWDSGLAEDMRRETLMFFEEVVWKRNRPLSDLLNAQVAFLTPQLADHYGLNPQGEGLTRYDLESVPSRGGLLTQGSVLTVGGDEASTVTRGLFVLQDLLRGKVNDPPPCVDTTPIPTEPGLTKRSIAMDRVRNPSCGGCHSKFEPLSFGLLKFDGLGTYHEKDEHGNPVEDDGEILFPGEAEPVAYNNAAELMELLAKSDRVKESLTWKLTQFAAGRPLGPTDVPIVKEIHRSAQENGGTYEALIEAVVNSELVQKIQTETSHE